MKSVTTHRFRKALHALPLRIQNKARSTYQMWRNNPGHPSLDFKAIHSKDPIYAVRIGLGYRALGIMQDDTMIWFWIGSHEEYNTLINTL